MTAFAPSQSTTATTPLFTAGEVEQRTGVPATTLRQWERRYGLPNPQRSAGGYGRVPLSEAASSAAALPNSGGGHCRPVSR